MTVPLVILAFCSLVVGAYFEWTGGFADFLAHTPSLAYRAAAPRTPSTTPESHTDWSAAIEHRRGAGRHRPGGVLLSGRSGAGDWPSVGC